MVEPDWTNHYDVLQVASRADQDTIQRVFRHLAKRYHPDNVESGDATRLSSSSSRSTSSPTPSSAPGST